MVEKISLLASDISTHTLTWSVTKEESDKREREKDFNSHAHVERDRCNLCWSYWC